MIAIVKKVDMCRIELLEVQECDAMEDDSSNPA